MEKIPMTASGFKGLEDELNQLKNVERHEIIKAIAEARAHGDLSENAEYHAAKEKQSFIEGRVMELEDQIGRADVIDISKLSGSSVKFGAFYLGQNEGLMMKLGARHDLSEGLMDIGLQ